MEKQEKNQITSFEDFLTYTFLKNVRNDSYETVVERDSFFVELPKAPHDFSIKNIVASHILPEKEETVDIDDRIEEDWLQTFKNIRNELLKVEKTLDQNAKTTFGVGDFVHSLSTLIDPKFYISRRFLK